ncbi:MAG: HEPN domain-containing protein [Methanofollis sp.]|uniref:HEPN domain-containing protein n=1 Tax=Methanofollis sp. TaxID=2052835 RepID=UPI00260B0F50|nr:HEPN domain-containing protein [Methanofollis sp.]MDD4256127.1 HEPN domain-containing protein [Methanofollis sp.]
MKYQFEQCLKRGKIVRIPVDQALVAKEVREAGEDLTAAEHSLAEGNMKWAIIQGYYAQFHALRALVFAGGYREKSHTCLRHAVEALYIDENILPSSVLEDFTFAMRTREGADYGCVYSEKDAHDVVTSAGAVLDLVRAMLE